VFADIIAALHLTPAETAFMGDDWLDMPLLRRVGLAATVADAVPEVRDIVHYITVNPGGRGGVREVCDLLIRAQGKREWLLRHVEEL
ncbi:MAG: HAD hydrolase family protein, partial [Deltaproteobacteria bacterium]|nr:HAD hydrolase family protein [Deltaproteobacteria bacterium]